MREINRDGQNLSQIKRKAKGSKINAGSSWRRNYQPLSECVSYIIVVHEFGAVTSQSAGEKLPRFDGRWG